MCTRLTSVQFKWVFTQCFWAHAYREFIGNSQSKNSALTEYFKKCDDKTLLIWQNSVNLLVYEFHHSSHRSNSVDCLRFIWIISNTFTTLQCHSSIVPNPLIGLFVKNKMILSDFCLNFVVATFFYHAETIPKWHFICFDFYLTILLLNSWNICAICEC